MTAEEESQLTKLKKVLDAALESQSLAEKADPKSKGIQMSAVREALSDISNVPTGAVSFQKSKSVASADSSVDQVTGHVDLEEGLIPVKVVYQNPAFQSQLSVPKASKNKTKANHRSVGVKAKDPNLIPDLLGQKKRTFKKNVSSPSLKVAVPVQTNCQVEESKVVFSVMASSTNDKYWSSQRFLRTKAGCPGEGRQASPFNIRMTVNIVGLFLGSSCTQSSAI
ncbi:hypothetical protein LINPERPRIM_LOCUS2263 [Linum perenne]